MLNMATTMRAKIIAMRRRSGFTAGVVTEAGVFVLGSSPADSGADG